MTAFLSRALRRRALLQGLLAAAAFPLFREASTLVRTPVPPEDDEIVEVAGWILKRSDLA